MWQRMLCILFYIFFMIAKSCRSGVCSPDSLMCSLNLHNHNQKFCRTSLMNCSKTRPQDCLVFLFAKKCTSARNEEWGSGCPKAVVSGRLYGHIW